MNGGQIGINFMGMTPPLLPICPLYLAKNIFDLSLDFPGHLFYNLK